MKTIKHILPKITLGFIFIATFFLPIKTSISNIGLIGLVITSFIAFGVSGFQKKGKLSFFLLFSPMVFFLPLIWGWIYSPFQGEAFREISKYMFLGLTPLLLFRQDISAEKFRKYAALGLLSGVIISGIVLLIINFYNYIKTDYPFYWLLNYTFTSSNFLAPLKDIHPIYMGMYYSLALGVLLFTKLKFPKWMQVASFIIITLSIVFLASRIIYGVLILLVLLYLIHHLSFKSFAVLVTGVLALGALSFGFIEKTYIYNKTVKGTLWELQENVGTYNTSQSQKVDSRWSRWQVSIDAIKERPILGYGGASENEVLLKKYKKHHMQNSINEGYNAHNQFVGFYLRFGFFGFILMIIYFVKNGITAFKHQNLLFLAFLTILFWAFMVENILDRNMGINFVALFGTLFYAEFLNEKKKEERA